MFSGADDQDSSDDYSGKSDSSDDGPIFAQSSSSASTTQQAQTQSPPLGGVSADQERQILLMMLLAQVCALHDPTPRTFTVHVLELFERGILGRQSIHFLFELGLVPTSPTRLLPPPTPSSPSSSSSSSSDSSSEDQRTRVRSFEITTVPPKSPTKVASGGFSSLRSQEASAIRSDLEEHERRTNTDFGPGKTDWAMGMDAGGPTAAGALGQPGQPQQGPSSWAVEHHPLSLSRYQREFEQIRLLNSGSFGEVYQATNKMDGRDYAIKKVVFSAWGYSKDSVTQVVREVHCLAHCDHPNVVRYYTSWLEPSWMTGSSNTAQSDRKTQQKLLTDIQRMVTIGTESKSQDQSSGRNANNMKSYFTDTRQSLQRRFSFGDDLDDYEADSSWDDSDCSDWTIDNNAKDDSYLYQRHSKNDRRDEKNKRQQNQASHYRYQICLFIQMQLCHPATLGDWIRMRNKKYPKPSQHREQLGLAGEIFAQIVSGLDHVHDNGIIHRDLKPANIFASLEHDLQFKIGDFGLSKLIQSVTKQRRTKENAIRGGGVVHDPRPSLSRDPPLLPLAGNSTWNGPHTVGIGTASYAAPEQVATKSYGKEADIFSLGLILLELFSSFSTEHERIQMFHDCRHRRDLPNWIKEEYPVVASTIISCTNPDPSRRPSTKDLINSGTLIDSDTFTRNQAGLSITPTSNDVQKLWGRLLQKDEEIQNYKKVVMEKDLEISELRKEIERLRSQKTSPTRGSGGKESKQNIIRASETGSAHGEDCTGLEVISSGSTSTN